MLAELQVVRHGHEMQLLVAAPWSRFVYQHDALDSRDVLDAVLRRLARTSRVRRSGLERRRTSRRRIGS